MSAASDAEERWAARSFIRSGLFIVLLLLGGLGGWSAFAKLSGAVVTSGKLRVETERQVVQHPDGGVVGEILVREGDFIDAGEVVIRLDGSTLLSELAVIESQLFELMARRGRLTAEQNDKDELSFDPELLEIAAGRPEVARLIEGQSDLFAARRETLERELAVLTERQQQIREQIVGSEGEAAALLRQSQLIEDELVGQRQLLAQGLAQANRVLSLEREAARLEGERGQMLAQTAQLKGQISEIEIERLRLASSRREEAIRELRDIGFRELELAERRIATRDKLDRLEIRAPVGGIVYDMTIHALKAVVRPAEPILYIVPSDAQLVIDTQVEPIDIDQLYPGQEAVLRFSAFNQRTTPELFGTVVRVSPDAFTEESTGRNYFIAEVDLNPGEIEKLEGNTLMPGMPVDVFIQTHAQTPINYLMKPLTDYFSRAMREE
jgi:HlyD family secretion protein